MGLGKVEDPTKNFRQPKKEEKQEPIVLTRLPSALIRLAVKDAKLSLEQGLEIDMHEWGAGTLESGPENCSVCFAGAVMLQTLVSEKDLEKSSQEDLSGVLLPEEINGGSNSDQLRFLDLLRQGQLRSAMSYLEFEHPNQTIKSPLIINEWVKDIPKFKEFNSGMPKKFFKQMLKIAEKLEKLNY